MAFIQRTTLPTAEDLYWTGNGHYPFTGPRGYNNCILGNTYKGTHPLQWPGCVLPNCTGYAVGRYMECQGVTSTPLYNEGDMDARAFWTMPSPGITKSQTPQQGAIMVWDGGTYGHVAVVEEIHQNGIITWSESNWGNPDKDRYSWYGTPLWWQRVTRNPHGYAGTFMGYLLPFTETDSGTDPLTWTWQYWDGSGFTPWTEASPEMQNNAKCFYYKMHGAGFSPEAIAGMLGNIQTESFINPHQAEVGGFGGYGLVGWTPRSKLIDWANQNGLDYHDGDVQCDRIIYEFANGIQYGPNGNWGTPPISGSDYKVSRLPPETLAEYFLKWYENPALSALEQTIETRKRQARFWYNYILNLPEDNTGPEYIPPTESPVITKPLVPALSAIFATKKGGRPWKEIISI